MKTWRLHLARPRQKKLGARHLAALAALSAVIAVILVYHVPLAAPYTLDTSGELEDAVRSGAVAVMFSSPTCQSCARMKPHWIRLAEAQQRIGVKFYIVELNSRTADAFRRYNVTHTPTFILYYNGRPAARHVGVFPGNATEAMLEWISDSLLTPNAASAGGPGEACSGGACRAELNIHDTGEEALTAAALAAAFTAGLLSSLSPCTLPLLLAFAASGARGRRLGRAAGCFAASTATILAAGLALSMLPWPRELLYALAPFTGVLLVSLGAAEALGYELELPRVEARRLGYWGSCSLLGLLSTQCSLPLLLGPLMLAIGTTPYMAAGALSIAASYAVGLSLVLAALLAGSGRAHMMLERLLGGGAYTRAVGAVTLASGLILVAYSLPWLPP